VSRSGWIRKISPLPGFDPRTVQPVASRYTDCVTSALPRPQKCVQIPFVLCGLIACYVVCCQVYILTWQLFVFLTSVSVAAVSGFEPDKDEQRSQLDEETARKYLENLESQMDIGANIGQLVRWAYESNITEENLKNQVRKCGKVTIVTCYSYVFLLLLRSVDC
jgi:hypothetical protein